MNILQVNASARRDGQSTHLANSIVERLRARHPEARLTRRDLAVQPHPCSTRLPWGPCSPRPNNAPRSRLPGWPWMMP